VSLAKSWRSLQLFTTCSCGRSACYFVAQIAFRSGFFDISKKIQRKNISVVSLMRVYILAGLLQIKGGEPIYYHGPHDLCNIAGGPQNQFYPKILPLFNYEEEWFWFWLVPAYHGASFWRDIVLLTWVAKILMWNISNVHVGRIWPCQLFTRAAFGPRATGSLPLLQIRAVYVTWQLKQRSCHFWPIAFTSLSPGPINVLHEQQVTANKRMWSIKKSWTLQ